MKQTRCGQRWIAAACAVPAALLLAGSAQAQTDEPAAPAEPAAQMDAASETPKAKAPQALFIESMGPESYPGQLRGIKGGSLWLEPSFHGLQWPQNSRTGIGVSGSFWVDAGKESISRGTIGSGYMPSSNMNFEQGRGLLRVTPGFVHDNFFIQGQIELVGNLCQGVDDTASYCASGSTFTADDMWIRVGQRNSWDLKVGRFEGWEIYHMGLGLDPYTLERRGAGTFGADVGPLAGKNLARMEAPTPYGPSNMHDRPTEGQSVGVAALHAYLADYLRIEVLGKFGSDKYQVGDGASDNTNVATHLAAYNYLGARPTAIVDIGWLKFKAGVEYQKRTATSQIPSPGDPPIKDPVAERVNKAFATSVQFVIDPIVEFGVNASIGTQHQTTDLAEDDPAHCFTTRSVGAFANLSVAEGWLVGAGLHYSEWQDEVPATATSTNDFASQWQAFGALQYQLAGQLYMKAVLAYANAKFQPSDASIDVWKNSMLSGRIRLMYLY